MLMIKTDINILKTYKKKKPISSNHYLTIKHLETLGLIEIDKLYINTINEVIILYAKTSKLGNELLKKYKRQYFKLKF